MNVKLIRQWMEHLNKNLSSDYGEGYLDCHEKYKPLVRALEKQLDWFNSVAKKQKNLLLIEQDLESASKNWKEATTLDSPLDFEPLIKALDYYRKEILGEK